MRTVTSKAGRAAWEAAGKNHFMSSLLFFYIDLADPASHYAALARRIEI